MKIAQVTHSFPPYMSGTGNACYHNAIELAKLGHDVTVYTYDFPNQKYEYDEKITVKKLPYLFKLGNTAFTPGLLNLKGFDVIQLHYPFFFGAEFVYIVSKLRKMRYVISYHNDAISGGLIGLYFKFYKNTVMKLILSGSDRIIISSYDYGNNSFLKNYIRGNPKKIVEIPYGVDVDRFNQDVQCDDIKKQHGLDGNKTVLFVGGLDKPHYFKGLDYLIESIAKIKNSGVKLLIVGDGDLKDHYIDTARVAGVGDRVIFAGKISDEDLPKYYSSCDVFVLPSVTTGESFGLVLVEAMASGKPVIASDLPGLRAVVDDGKNGFLASPKDADAIAIRIEELLNNPELSKSCGENGRKKVEEKYSWSIIGKQLEKVLLNVTGNR